MLCDFLSIKRKIVNWKKIVIDFIYVALIVGFGWFLIGYYASGQYLSAGYEDWMMHAWRVRDLEEFGLSSWTFRWANGISHWRSYQFLPHLAALGIHQYAGASITKAMLYLTIGVFIGIRVLTYALIRRLGIAPFPALFAVGISYAFAQQWQQIGDFTIFIANISIPLFVYVWIMSATRKAYDYLLVLMSGTAWFFHPVIAFMMTFLFVAKKIFELKNTSKSRLAILVFLYVACFALFAIPVLQGDFFTKPVFSSADSTHATLPYEYLGSSIAYVLAIIISGIAIFFIPSRHKRWSRMLLVISISYVLLLLLALAGYASSVLNQLQISRAVTAALFIAPFFIAAGIEAIRHKTSSRAISGVLVVLLVSSLFHAVDLGSTNSPSIFDTHKNSLKSIVENLDVDSGGRVYMTNNSESVYYSSSDVFVAGSYMDHQLPSPLSFRYKSILNTNYTLSNLSKKRLELIEAYSNVLGVQRIVLPVNSAISQKLLNDDAFEDGGVTKSSKFQFRVLDNTTDVADAFLVDKARLPAAQDIPFPDLSSQSYVPWDSALLRTYEALYQGKANPLKVEYDLPSRMSILLEEGADLSGQVIHVNQHYDEGWIVENMPAAKIEPTALKQMRIVFDEGTPAPSSIALSHQWPAWYLVLLYAGLSIFLTSMLSALILVVLPPDKA